LGTLPPGATHPIPCPGMDAHYHHDDDDDDDDDDDIRDRDKVEISSIHDERAIFASGARRGVERNGDLCGEPEPTTTRGGDSMGDGGGGLPKRYQGAGAAGFDVGRICIRNGAIYQTARRGATYPEDPCSSE
jgi:hypothetical protein